MPHPLLRLSSYEYRATLRDALGSEVADAAEALLTIVPNDRVGGRFEKEGQTLTALHVQAYYQVADLIARRLEDDAGLRVGLAPCLESPDEACVRQFVEQVGPQILRRPLTGGEVDRYLDLARASETGLTAGFADVVAALLQSPSFLFHVELGNDDAEAGASVALAPHELANRLAYAITGAPPDASLRGAAADGTLTPQTVTEHATRMLESERGQAHAQRFVLQWLDLEALPDLENPPDHVRGDLALDGLNEGARGELDATVEHVLFGQAGGYGDLLRTRHAVVDSDALAAVYGLEPGTTGVVALPADRAGILARVGYLGDATGMANPVVRGARVARQLLCTDPDPSDLDLPDDALDEPPLDPDMTTRERFAAKTSPQLCAGCHAVINPFGFALEGIDGLGRARTIERVFSIDGELVAELPIDDAATIPVDGAQVEIAGAAALGDALAASTAVRECVATQWLAFTEGTREPEHGACEDAPFADLAAADLGAAMVAHVTHPAFSRRVAEPL